MLYTQNLEELIFHRHEIHETDEFIVLSGYLGPRPVFRLEELPFNSTVIYGMYGSEGIRPSLHNSLTNIQGKVTNVNIFYSNLPVPSKAELGEYIRTRIGVPLGQPVRRHHLERYGRTDIRISLLGEGVYKFDFSI